ncbi:VIT family protein [bacterium]|nr:VIT family protein [bacterium]
MKLPQSEHHFPEPHGSGAGTNTNWLRAAVLGANDGIVSVAALIVGVAGATSDPQHIFITGIAGLLAGALSMAVGEYVSVSSQRDTEKALLAKEKWELENMPEAELEELTKLYEEKGLSRETADLVARELTKKDALAAHVDAELGIDPSGLTNPWHAAFASGASFIAGAIIPLIAVVLPTGSWRIPLTFVAVLIALAITGILSARVSGADVPHVTMRVVVGGAIAMAITYGIGFAFGIAL